MKCQRFTPSGCKDKGIRKLKFAAKPQFFSWIEKFQNWYFLINEVLENKIYVKSGDEYICLFAVKEAGAGYKVITHVNPIDGSITVESPGKQFHWLIDS